MTPPTNRTYPKKLQPAPFLPSAMKHNSQQHHFFLHAPDFDFTVALRSVTTLPPQTAHRISSILRLREKEHVTLFSGQVSTEIELQSISGGKKSIVTGTVVAIKKHATQTPRITLVCGIVKDGTFEEICYTATQLGVDEIVPLITQRSYTKPYSEKDYARFTALCIAAAEQSKQIILPTLLQPQKFIDYISSPHHADMKIIFEADGQPLRTLLSAPAAQSLIVAFGPEGGFSDEEQRLLLTQNFTKLRLCESILRTQDAVEVGIGVIRCLF